METDKLLRIDKVTDMTSLSKSEIYRRVQAGTFPRQTRISHRYAAWKQSDLTAWMKGALGA